MLIVFIIIVVFDCVVIKLDVLVIVLLQIHISGLPKDADESVQQKDETHILL